MQGVGVGVGVGLEQFEVLATAVGAQSLLQPSTPPLQDVVIIVED
jgi:hypothetical protein